MEKYVVRSDPTYRVYSIVVRRNLIEHKTVLQTLPVLRSVMIMYSTMAQEH